MVWSPMGVERAGVAKLLCQFHLEIALSSRNRLHRKRGPAKLETPFVGFNSDT